MHVHSCRPRCISHRTNPFLTTSSITPVGIRVDSLPRNFWICRAPEENPNASSRLSIHSMSTPGSGLGDDEGSLHSRHDFEHSFRQKLSVASCIIPQPIKCRLVLGADVKFDIPAQDVALQDSAIEHPTHPTARKTMSVLEVVNNQPQTNPLPIQRAFAREIIATITGIDGFGWSSQRAARTGDGWFLIYHCSNSYDNMSRR